MPGADQIYHRLFSHPLMVEQLVRDFVDDAMAAGLDFRGMARVSAKSYGRSGARRDGDVIWRIPTAYGTDIYLYLMLEFQSQSDPWMPVRTLVYQGLLWQQIIAETRLKSEDRLPPVLLVAIYNGGRRWLAETRLDRLIALPKDSPLWRWQPQARYHLLDMGAIPGEKLAGKRSLATLLVRLEQQQDPDTLLPLIDEVIDWFRRHPDYDGLKRLFAELVTNVIEGSGMPLPVPDDLQEMKTMLETLGKTWREEWTAEGRAQGLAEGMAKGLMEGQHQAQVRTLLRHLERRFGPVPEEVRQRVESADAGTLDRWLDRILDAPTREAVFEQ
ncbi:MAG: hypothetical protein GVY13_11505 [Alphaproteobacteria bacterium]|jgi:hypothetical protein|nr:hypothetical protein [Alphaproteobacteria bacterium]